MLFIYQILVRTFALGFLAVALVACGQPGPLYMPATGSSHRATLPESLLPAMRNTAPSVPPATAASSAQHP